MRANILANFFGKSFIFLLGFIVVPLYIKILGAESYGVIAFFAVLFATVGFLEFGLGITVNREIARALSSKSNFEETLDLIRSSEIIYWLVGLILAAIVYELAPEISTNWLQSRGISKEVVLSSIQLMGLIIAFQWPASFYSCGLMGMERQILLNVVFIGFSIIRSVGSILVLWQVSSTLTAYFIWQLIVSIIYVFVIAFIFWRMLPRGARMPRFSLTSLRRVRNFTLGMGATGMVTFLLSNLDKVILSKMLNLVDFGYYSIANQLNTATRTSSGAVCQAIFPRLSVLHLKNDVDKLTSFFHKASQFISLIVLPTSIVIAFFSREILFVWLQNWEIATSVALIASVLIVGSAFNSAMGIPYDMSVASGWTTFGLYQNIVSSLIIIPLMLWLIYVYGALGAAIAWLILNFGYLVIAAPIIISRCLPKGELSVWYIDDVGKPLLACLFFVVLARYFFQKIIL
jgi:O-antigen/teichoic acid export membrane protein